MYTTKLNKTTKKAEAWIKAYNNSSYYGIDYFYKSCSSAKYRAETQCKDRMKSINGYGYKVLGGSSSFFTCGYLSEDGKTLYIETQCNTFEIAL